LLTFYPCSIRKTSLTRLVLGRTHQPLVPHELGSSWTWTRWIKGCPSCSLNVSSPSRSILLHMFWTSPFNASLSFFALTLVIGPIGTSNGSLEWLRLVLGWSASHLVTLKVCNMSLKISNFDAYWLVHASNIDLCHWS